jgi:hypothetical protein
MRYGFGVSAHSSGSLRVQRERFLVLVAAIASSTCTERHPGAPPPKNVSGVEVPPAVEPEPEPEPEAVEAPAAAGEEPRSSCDNDVGEVDCSAMPRMDIGPACEGHEKSCSLLASGGYGYRRRAAAAIARCWERLGSRACDMRARKACNREAVLQACPEVRFEAACQAALDACKSARARIDYTLKECVQVMSSLDDAGERDWALSAMGPASEGCRLMFPVY